MFQKIVLAVLAVAVLGGCATTAEHRIDRNNEFAVAKVNGACDALSAFPERYARCMAGEEQAFLDCYEKKITARVMPSEALAICRVAVDSKGKVEPGLSANPRNGDEQFGVNSPGYRGYGNRGNRGYGYGNGGNHGYGGGYRSGPVVPTVVNQIGPMFTVQPAPAPIQYQQAPAVALPSQCANLRAVGLGAGCP